MDTKKINKGKTLMVAHRGVSGIEKENTLSAFVAAGNRSYFGVETDVHRTVDGKFIIIHDDCTGRVAPVNIEIEKSTFDTLRAVHLNDIDNKLSRNDLVLPSLDEYINICKKYDKVCVLELKNTMAKEDIKNIIEIIKGCEYLENVIFISFSIDNLIALRELLPEQRAQFLCCELNDTVKKYLIDYNLDIDIMYTALNEEGIKWLHDNGKKINIWTCDNPVDGEKFAAWGVDFITSNILE